MKKNQNLVPKKTKSSYYKIISNEAFIPSYDSIKEDKTFVPSYNSSKSNKKIKNMSDSHSKPILNRILE